MIGGGFLLAGGALEGGEVGRVLVLDLVGVVRFVGAVEELRLLELEGWRTAGLDFRDGLGETEPATFGGQEGWAERRC